MAKPGPSRPLMVCSSRAATGLIGGNGGGLSGCWAVPEIAGNRIIAPSKPHSRPRISRSSSLCFLGFFRFFFFGVLGLDAADRPDDDVYDGHVARPRFDVADLVDHIHAVDDFAEDGV